MSSKSKTVMSPFLLLLVVVSRVQNNNKILFLESLGKYNNDALIHFYSIFIHILNP